MEILTIVGLLALLGLAIGWCVNRAPTVWVNERRCAYPWLLDEYGICRTPCGLEPPCTREERGEV